VWCDVQPMFRCEVIVLRSGFICCQKTWLGVLLSDACLILRSGSDRPAAPLVFPAAAAGA